jgi:flotillin
VAQGLQLGTDLTGIDLSALLAKPGGGSAGLPEVRSANGETKPMARKAIKAKPAE